MISPFTQSCVVIASANAIFTFVLSLMAAPHLLLRDPKSLPRIDDRRFKAIELNDLCVAGSVCEVGLCNSPERVATYHSVDAVVLGGFRACHGKRRGLDRRHNGVSAGLILVDDRTVAADLDNIPAELLHPAGNGFAVIVDVARDGHEVTDLDTYRCGLDRGGRFYITAESCRDLGCQIAHAGIHPVAGAALVRKPSVDSQNHLVRFRGVVQRLGLIPQPEQLRLAIALADVGAKLDEPLVHHILERIRLGIVAGALNGDGSLVVGCRRGTEYLKIKSSVMTILEKASVSAENVNCVASINKKADEKGIIELAEELQADFITYTADELMEVEGEFEPSMTVYNHVGADNVCGRSACRASCNGECLVPKTVENGVTVSVYRYRVYGG